MFYMVFVGIFFLIIFVAIIFLVVSLASFLKHYLKVSKLLERQLTLNQKLFDQLKNLNFNVSKTFYLNDNFTVNKDNNRKKLVNVDYKNKKIAFADYEKDQIIIADFNSVVNYEVYENANISTVGSNVGGWMVSAFSAQTNGMCKDLKLIIRLNNYENSHIVYNIVSSTNYIPSLNKSSNLYKSCVASLQEVVSFLEVVKNENEKTNPMINSNL